MLRILWRAVSETARLLYPLLISTAVHSRLRLLRSTLAQNQNVFFASEYCGGPADNAVSRQTNSVQNCSM
jgi:hypothetical protein